MKKTFILPTLLLIACNSVASSNQSVQNFYGKISPIPPKVKKLMRRYTWKPACPVSLTKLRYLQLSYYGFDHKAHVGVMIVNASLAKEVLTLFKLLYQHKFPIQSIIPMYKFKGSDEASMQKNNSSSE